MNPSIPSWAPRLFTAAAAVTIAVAVFAVWRGIATDTATAGPSSPGSSIDASDATPVEISNFAFDPQTVTVAAGSTIAWTNGDQVAHSVRSDDGAFDEQQMDGGESVVVRLDQPGTYAYFCGIHPAMTGTIEVTS